MSKSALHQIMAYASVHLSIINIGTESFKGRARAAALRSLAVRRLWCSSGDQPTPVVGLEPGGIKPVCTAPANPEVLPTRAGVRGNRLRGDSGIGTGTPGGKRCSKGATAHIREKCWFCLKTLKCRVNGRGSFLVNQPMLVDPTVVTAHALGAWSFG
ncbi:hypothetical protein Esti_004789 [Eimeria stiedai]